MFDESYAEAWRQRFGREPEGDLPLIAPLLAHRSVRKYAARPVDDATIAGLVAAAQSAATSSNLQLWSVVSIQDPARREAIAALCADQRQIRECGVFFAFLADHHRLRHAAGGQGGEGLDYTEFFAMAVVDASLAAERMVCAAEFLGLGICYIGALRNDPEGVARLLELPEGVFGVFGLCIGYPADDADAEIKPRLAPEAVHFRETYNREPDTAEYDARMRAFYERQKRRGDVTWSMRSARRTGEGQLTGREVLLEWLRARGFLRR